MATDQNARLGARARAAATGNSMALLVGGVLLSGFLVLVMYAVFGDRISTDTAVTTPPASTAPVTPQPTTTPPANTTTPTIPAPTPSTK